MTEIPEECAAPEDIEQQLNALKNELLALRARNQRVEIDKAWEQSRSRKVFLLLLTYLIASLVFMALGSVDPFLSALIPTVGYLISTFSLPAVRRRWQRLFFPDPL